MRYAVAPAEATGLPDGCADLVVAAQCMHWWVGGRVGQLSGRVGRYSAQCGLAAAADNQWGAVRRARHGQKMAPLTPLSAPAMFLHAPCDTSPPTHHPLRARIWALPCAGLTCPPFTARCAASCAPAARWRCLATCRATSTSPGARRRVRMCNAQLVACSFFFRGAAGAAVLALLSGCACGPEQTCPPIQSPMKRQPYVCIGRGALRACTQQLPCALPHAPLPQARRCGGWATRPTRTSTSAGRTMCFGTMRVSPAASRGSLRQITMARISARRALGAGHALCRARAQS